MTRSRGARSTSDSPSRVLPGALLARWGEDLESWGAPPACRAALERLTDSATPVVVTGQQPGPWGGPLYALYKAATAVAQAEAITAREGHPTTAIFWVQGDDTDWGEVGWGALPRPDLSLYRHRFESPGTARHWVGSGRIASPPAALELAPAWGRSPDLLGSLPRSEPEELSTSFIKSLIRVFGEFGLLPLDARHPEVREAGAPLWSRYLDRHAEIARALRARGRELAGRGESAPLGMDALDHGLFILDGERRREVDPAAWEAEIHELLEGGNADRLAPSVLLRAALQDVLLTPVTHVVGPTEAAYLRQLTPLYHALDVVEPERTQRMQAVVIPGGLLPVPERVDILRDPEAWIAARARDTTFARAREELGNLRGRMAANLDRIEEATRGAGDVAEALASARRRLDYELRRVDESLDRRGRRDLYRAEPRYRHLSEFLRPRRGDQDRGLSGGTLALILGERTPRVLMEAARDHLAKAEPPGALPVILEALDG